jgi:hypothetical protein
MAVNFDIVAHEGVDEALVTQIRSWANEVLEKVGPSSSPSCLRIRIWKTMKELQDFYRSEKEELGVITGDETEFLATHEAWRGYPRIHICEKRLGGIPGIVVQGVLHHEIGHALLHGSPEFYTFRFSVGLQEVGRSQGLDLPVLQQCVYLLSLAIKDGEVVQWLGEIGLGSSQRALVEYLISDTQEELKIWEQVRNSPVLIKIARGAFLKTLLPIEVMVLNGIEGAQALKNQWREAYGWLSERERERISGLIRYLMNQEKGSFQQRLEEATLVLIAEPSI